MTAVHRARHIATAAAAISAGIALITFVAASTAVAAPGGRALAGRGTATADRASGGTGASPGTVSAAGKSGQTLQTLVSGVEVFASPSLGARGDGKMATMGTSVTVSCWTTGSAFTGDPIWYSITAPQAGFVPAYEMAAHLAPVPGLPHCLAPAFSRDYHSLVLDLKIRAEPLLSATVLATLGPVGTATDVTCWAAGSPVLGDTTWYYETTPAAGYVSGRYLNTGGDPAQGVPHC